MAPVEASPQPNVTDLQISLHFWFVIVLTGAGSGLAGGLLMKLLRLSQHLSYSYTSGDFLTGVEHVSPLHRFVVLVFSRLACRNCSLWHEAASA